MSVQVSNIGHAPAVAEHHSYWRSILPLALVAAGALWPVPAGLAPHAWYYFAIFTGVIAALVMEPLPSPAIGVIGVTTVTVLAPWVLFHPAEAAKPNFKMAEESIRWGLSGFSSSTVWLVFGAFMFALGYEKTGLGRRIAYSLPHCWRSVCRCCCCEPSSVEPSLVDRRPERRTR